MTEKKIPLPELQLEEVKPEKSRDKLMEAYERLNLKLDELLRQRRERERKNLS